VRDVTGPSDRRTDESEPSGTRSLPGTRERSRDLFLFVSQDGTVSGWRPTLGTAAETLAVGSSANSYTGTTLVTNGANTYILAANDKTGNIDVIKSSAGEPNLTGSFKDPNLPTNSSPYNIQILNGTVYVTYFLAGSKTGGIVDAFDTQGNFLARVAGVGANLDQPWGLAIAPSSFGSIAGDLLVGDKATGEISIIDLKTNTLVGLLDGTNGQPLMIGGLWALVPGDGGNGGNADEIYFSSGPQGYSNGVFGAIRSVPEPGSAVLGLIAVGALAGRWHWKNRRRGVRS
jgi:uncharacterized protein (TIGR03118 family)